jgi:hypothetical protein
LFSIITTMMCGAARGTVVVDDALADVVVVAVRFLVVDPVARGDALHAAAPTTTAIRTAATRGAVLTL